MTGDTDLPDNKDLPDNEETSDLDDDSSDSLDEDVGVDIDELDIESTAEIDVEKLVAKLDATDAEDAARRREIREKLEALNEQRDDKFGSTYNFDLDKDI